MLDALHAAIAPVMAGQNVAAGGAAMSTPGSSLFQGFNIRLEFLHTAVFDILYGMCVLVTFVAIERIIFFSLGAAMRSGWSVR